MKAASVLVVDDDPGLCQALSEALTLRGYAVETVARGDAALQRTAAGPVDAVIVDIILPDLSGLDLLRAIKSQPSDTEVIVITGYASLPSALEAVNGAAFAYLVKPFALDHLLATVAKALEKQELARARRDSESRYRLITEQIRDAVFLLDLAGRVTFANGQGGQLLGIAPEELEGHRLADLLGEEAGSVCAPAGSRAAGERAGVAEIEIRRSDGGRCWIEVTQAPVLEGGREVGRLAVVRDLTQKRRAEDEIRRQREALFRSEKLAALGQLLAGVAHELNNPLSVVLGQTVLIRETAEEPRVVARADKIAQAAERCARIVRDFLALARRYPRDRQGVDLSDVVRQVVDVAREVLAAQAIEVSLDLAPGLPPVWADRSQLDQVVANLVSNAHQALQDGAHPRRLLLRTRFDAKRERLVLEVVDNGPGVAPDARRRLFEPFFTTRAHGQGTGLGLALCQGIVEGHGGRIVHELAAGGGATFRVELPVRGPEEGPSTGTAAPAVLPETLRVDPPLRRAPTPRAPAGFRGRRILVVEDEAPVAQVLAELLEMDGHHVDAAPDGETALERLGEVDYDVVMSDLRMPGLGGPGLYRAVERSWPERCSRFVFMTGDTTGEEATAFLEATGALSLAKPLVLDEVRHAIRSSVARQVLAPGPD
jgi:PAS domain S-box-containing protein